MNIQNSSRKALAPAQVPARAPAAATSVSKAALCKTPTNRPLADRAPQTRRVAFDREFFLPEHAVSPRSKDSVR